jgi:hypothetical protein
MSQIQATCTGRTFNDQVQTGAAQDHWVVKAQYENPAGTGTLVVSLNVDSEPDFEAGDLITIDINKVPA